MSFCKNPRINDAAFLSLRVWLHQHEPRRILTKHTLSTDPYKVVAGRSYLDSRAIPPWLTRVLLAEDSLYLHTTCFADLLLLPAVHEDASLQAER